MTNPIAKILSFANDRRAGASVQVALMFGAVAIALSVLAAPFLDRLAISYAENRALEIDRVMTGNVETVRQYTIRRSVLDK